MSDITDILSVRTKAGAQARSMVTETDSPELLVDY